MIFELQKEREAFKREFEKAERELTNQARKKANDEQFTNDKISDLEAKIERKRQKINLLKTVNTISSFKNNTSF